MVTLRSAVSDKQRVTWSTGGVKVAPSPKNNNSKPAARAGTSNTNMTKEKRRKKAGSARTTSPKMTTRSMAAVDAREAALSVNKPNLSDRQTKVPNNKPKPKPKKKELVPASPRQITTRSMKKLLAPVKKSSTVSATGKKKVAVKDKKNTTMAPTRRSTRLAQRNTDPNISPMDNEDLPIHPTGDMPDAPENTSPCTAPVPNDNDPISSTHSTQNDILPTTSDATTESATIAQNKSADAGTMQSYMAAIRRRIDAIESRELLLASINAPCWSDELHRDLLKEVVKAWSAISVGRFKDINEVVQLPLEHTYWTEEIRVTQNALRDARRYYDGLKQEAIDQEDEEMEEELQ